MTFTSKPENGGNFTTMMTPAINWRDELKIKVALVRATVCRAWPTIGVALANNKIQYRTDAGVTYTVTISDGQYTFEMLNSVLHKFMKAKGHYTTEVVDGITKEVYFINIGANLATGRIVITLRNSYNFNIQLSDSDLRSVLGFSSGGFVGTVAPIEFEGDKIPDFNGGITEVHIRSDLIKGTSAFSNGVSAPIVYTFTPDKMPHAYMITEPTQRIYHDISNNKFNSVRIWLTDQDGNPLTTGGERTTVVLDVN